MVINVNHGKHGQHFTIKNCQFSIQLFSFSQSFRIPIIIFFLFKYIFIFVESYAGKNKIHQTDI